MYNIELMLPVCVNVQQIKLIIIKVTCDNVHDFSPNLDGQVCTYYKVLYK